MGGFCVLRGPGAGLEPRRRAAEAALAGLGMPPPVWLDLPGGCVAYWRKSLAGEAQLWRGSGGDFALAAGTFVFDELAGAPALAAFHAAAGPHPERLLPRTLGQFTLLLRRGEQAWLLHDRIGFHQLFRAPGDVVLSTSFLLATALLERVSVDPGGLLEFVLSGVPLGDATPLAELRLLGKDMSLRLDAHAVHERQHPSGGPGERWADADEAAEACLSALRGTMGRLLRALGRETASALSGGYDSRLLLALLRERGVRPHLFVYGGATSPDVACAKAIAAGEGLTLDHVDKARLAPPDPERFAATVEADFLAQDGYGQEGIFDHGGERAARARRIAAAPFQLHGGGGECLRDFFYLPDRPYRPRGLLLSFWGGFDPAAFAQPWTAERYLAGIEMKLGSALGALPAQLQRAEVEWLYPHFRCRAWIGREASTNQRFAPLAVPFLEPPVVAAALRVPLALKRHGRFEGGLIGRLDPRLAAYPSAYGHPLDGAVPCRRRLAEQLTYRRPPLLRHASFRLKRLLGCAGASRTGPGPSLLARVLPGPPELVGRFLRPERVREPGQQRRLLSTEYLLRRLGARLIPP